MQASEHVYRERVVMFLREMAIEMTCSGSGGLTLIVRLLTGALRVGKEWFLCMYATYEIRLIRLCQCGVQRLNYIFAIIHVIWEQSLFC